MYLYCYTLDLRKSAVKKALCDSYEMHRTVMSAYRNIDSDMPRKDMGILYRLVSLNNVSKLYVSSIEQAKYDMPDGFINEIGSPKSLLSVLECFKDGMLLNFDIMAMPAKKIKEGNAKNSKRVFLSKYEDREQWLHKKSSQNGFRVLACIEKNNADNSIKTGGFKSIVFQGTLIITDSSKFKEAYKHGIGAERAFGCGMLLLYKHSQ